MVLVSRLSRAKSLKNVCLYNFCSVYTAARCCLKNSPVLFSEFLTLFLKFNIKSLIYTKLVNLVLVSRLSRAKSLKNVCLYNFCSVYTAARCCLKNSPVLFSEFLTLLLKFNIKSLIYTKLVNLVLVSRLSRAKSLKNVCLYNFCSVYTAARCCLKNSPVLFSEFLKLFLKFNIKSLIYTKLVNLVLVSRLSRAKSLKNVCLHNFCSVYTAARCCLENSPVLFPEFLTLFLKFNIKSLIYTKLVNLVLVSRLSRSCSFFLKFNIKSLIYTKLVNLVLVSRLSRSCSFQKQKNSLRGSAQNLRGMGGSIGT